jgi:hypothetical protein
VLPLPVKPFDLQNPIRKLNNNNNNNKCNSYKAKKREKRKETLQIRRHAPVHVSEWTHAKDATED